LVLDTTQYHTRSLKVRAKLQHVLEHKYFELFVLVLVVLNGITLAAETYDLSYHATLKIVDKIFLGMFLLELLLKLFVYNVSFFKKGWNVFDAVVVGISIIAAVANSSALSALRILRVLKLLSAIPALRVVIEAILASAARFGAVVAVLSLLFFVYAIVGSKLFGEKIPELFGNLHESAFTLFQILTLDNWSEVARNLLNLSSPFMSFLVVMYFVTFIGITVFLLLSVIVGIASNAIKDKKEHTLSEEEIVKIANRVAYQLKQNK
jgi:voltage-gated sodium channel